MTDYLKDIASHKMPRHIAVIMDGNGRWAVRQGEDRTTGHQRGADVVKKIVRACSNLRDDLCGPDYLTLYSFSIENWKRPMDEVAFLMQMYVDYLADQLPVMLEKNIRFHQIGRTDNLPDPVIDAMQQAIHATRHNTGLNLVLAINYGSRAEITDAVKAIAKKVQAGELDVRDITEQTISQHLYTAGWPDPDLLIRTAGEMRLSNYLLWQISYAELYVSDVLWPDFDAAELHKAIRSFAGRNRRFGALDHTNTLLPGRLPKSIQPTVVSSTS
jgi:undecaprenyl diphosphate synthase